MTADATRLQIRSERLFNGLVVGIVVAGFLTLVGVAGYGLYVMGQNVTFTRWVSHTYEVEGAISDFLILDERTETARRGYLLSHDEVFAQSAARTSQRAARALDRIGALTPDNPAQQAFLARMRPLFAQQQQAVIVSMAFARAGHSDSSQFYHDSGVEATRLIRRLAEQMTEEETRLLRLRNAAQEAALDQLLWIAVAGGVLLVFVATGSTLVILRYTRQLNRSQRELAQLNAGLEDQVATRTADLQRANEEIQRFAYIVSHDLRSPLVNVMGFTSELEAAAKPLGVLLERAEAEAPQIVSEDARAAVRTDLPESIGFIRTSTQKMDRLINAILQLSRQGRRVLTPEPVDMVRVAQGIADNLKHRSQELGAEIEIAPDLPVVISDRLALEQIFSNLVENALKYLKPGRPGRIAVTGQHQGGRMVYEVRDNGRGIDPKDHDRVFDLFRRAGLQDQPGEGIGLAHVRALAYRLGGTVTCQSALDQGATFRVSLPARLSIQGSAS
ncbi:ATP-binding protein [Phenylobacterium sp.]|uniref:sensor histidine kinase n=1 Tax=Phenylobacterium sp. TaxID=1871053 RepID=UPI001227680B|nr:sensor histidine kinase [Phenylobacterium sp.]THD58605.1 MAG: histidine kinase [Phenylobacterium sp.]